MSPILVRPVREQLEHDRIIRLLPPKYKRRFVTAINAGADMNQAVGEGAGAIYPDAVLYAVGKPKKVAAIIEVETQESVNALEAKAQWVVYGRRPIEFWLYVPATAVDAARRFCHDNKVGVTEIWTYHLVGGQLRFTLVHRSPVEAKVAAARAVAAAAAAAQRDAERAEQAARRAAARKAAPKTGGRKAGAAPAARKAAPGSARPAAARGKPPSRKAARPAKPASRTSAKARKR